MASNKAAALERVEQFESMTGESPWKYINKRSLVYGMRDTLEKPDLINTSAVNLCGPCAFFLALVHDDPLMYVNAVIDLFYTGKGKIGLREFWASKDLLNADPGSTRPVDWVPLASLRDDENFVLEYDSNGGTLSGLTMPYGLERWFRQAGYKEVKNVTNVFFTKDMPNLVRAHDLRMQGYHVCLLIHHDMLDSESQDNWSFCPDHWVTLAGWVQVEDDQVSVKVHSWGKIMRVPAAGGMMDVDDFMTNYYGFVAAKMG